MSATHIIVTIIIVVAAAALAAAMWINMRRRSLRERFGPEYDRTVSEKDSRYAAERELRERERRHAGLTLRKLSAESRDRYAREWEDVQSRFIDSPTDAVSAGDALVTRLAAERGYPTADFEEQLAHLSVEHARTLGHYRDAHDIHLRNERGEASTEELRQALVHYRALFGELLGEDPIAHTAGHHADGSAAAPDAPPTDETMDDQTPQRQAPTAAGPPPAATQTDTPQNATRR